MRSVGQNRLALLLLMFFACGGKPRPPVRAVVPAPPPAARSETPPARPAVGLSPVQVAPAPALRVGLVSASDVVRISSSAPFVATLGDATVTTYDLLVERSRGALSPSAARAEGESRSERGGGAPRTDSGVSVSAVEAQVYRIQVASFVDRAPAEKLQSGIEKDTTEKAQIVRESVTGRYAVRLGRYGTEEGARAAAEGLKLLGYDGGKVVSEGTSSPGGPLVLRPTGGPPLSRERTTVTVLPRESGAFIEVDGVPYRGFMEILPAMAGGLTVVNVVSLEDYLRGVVPAELSPEIYPQVEALKAQAVAARTYALRHLGQFALEGFDICATPACQVYRGVSVEHRLSDEAVRGTANEVLTYAGELADTLYTSTCGGRTEDSQNVFSGPAQPYLVSRSCYAEAPPTRVRSTARALSPEAASAVSQGVVSEAELFKEPLEAPATFGTAVRWIGRSLAALGQGACRALPETKEPLVVARLAAALAQMSCWEARVPFLLSSEDVDRLVAESDAPSLRDEERRFLAFWIQDQVIRAEGRGLSPNRVVTRLDLLESLARFIGRRGEPLLVSGTLVAVEGDALRLKIEDREEVTALAPRPYLFRRVESASYFAPTLSLLPGDRLSVHRGPSGVDVVELQAVGASFDRSSRFSHWVVRKPAAQLTAEINSRDRVGEVVDLKPLRYGRSGRVAELAIVGTERTLTLRGLAIRTRLGLRENLFFIDRQQGQQGQQGMTGSGAAWVFSGRGWGHGVGLCQVGAFGMASAGYSYREILGHYYFQATVARSDALPSAPGSREPREPRP